MVTDELNDALEAMTKDERRQATSILLGYLWSSVNAETREQALDAARRNILSDADGRVGL